MVGPDEQRYVMTFPDRVIVGLILGYELSFKKVKWSTQLNIHNLFNTYDTIILPESTTAFTSAVNLSATRDLQPRSILWSNTISF